MIAIIHTLAIKVRFLVSLRLHALSHYIYTQIQASGLHIEYFHSIQICCRLPKALKILLHSNIHWRTACYNFLWHTQDYSFLLTNTDYVIHLSTFVQPSFFHSFSLFGHLLLGLYTISFSINSWSLLSKL